MANSYLYIHKMAKAHEDAIKKLRIMLGKLDRPGAENIFEDAKEILDILEKPDKEEKR